MKSWIEISIISLILFCGCQPNKDYEQLDGEWLRVDDRYQLLDTVEFPNYSDQEVSIYTIKTDSGFVDHLYRNDSLLIIDKTVKTDLLQISLLRGLITFHRKASLTDTLESIDFFNNYEIDKINDFIITTDGDSMKFNLINSNELVLNGNKYKRLINSP